MGWHVNTKDTSNLSGMHCALTCTYMPSLSLPKVNASRCSCSHGRSVAFVKGLIATFSQHKMPLGSTTSKAVRSVAGLQLVACVFKFGQPVKCKLDRGAAAANEERNAEVSARLNADTCIRAALLLTGVRNEYSLQNTKSSCGLQHACLLNQRLAPKRKQTATQLLA